MEKLKLGKNKKKNKKEKNKPRRDFSNLMSLWQLCEGRERTIGNLQC